MIARSTIDGGDELLTRDEAAALMRLSPHTLSCWRSAGKGPAVVKYGASRSAAVRYRRSDIERFLTDPARAEAEAGEPWRAARRQAAAQARAAAAGKHAKKKRRPVRSRSR